MSKKQLNDILDRIDEIRQRREELHEKYLKAKNEKYCQRVRERLHPLDELLDKYFYQAWQAYKFFKDELEKVAVYKGFDKKRRIVYCDGELHFVLTDSSKKGKIKFSYGYFCNC